MSRESHKAELAAAAAAAAQHRQEYGTEPPPVPCECGSTECQGECVEEGEAS